MARSREWRNSFWRRIGWALRKATMRAVKSRKSRSAAAQSTQEIGLSWL
jgi:hypothetical protein